MYTIVSIFCKAFGVFMHMSTSMHAVSYLSLTVTGAVQHPWTSPSPPPPTFHGGKQAGSGSVITCAWPE